MNDRPDRPLRFGDLVEEINQPGKTGVVVSHREPGAVEVRWTDGRWGKYYGGHRDLRRIEREPAPAFPEWIEGPPENPAAGKERTEVKLSDLPPKYQAQVAAQVAEQDARAEEAKALRIVRELREKRERESVPAKPARRKYRNVPVEVDGQRFDSRLEADVYARLVSYYGRDRVIRQVSFPVGSRRIRPDFLVLLPGGGFVLADAKGFATDAWTAKANHLRDRHGLGIVLIRKPGDAIRIVENGGVR